MHARTVPRRCFEGPALHSEGFPPVFDATDDSPNEQARFERLVETIIRAELERHPSVVLRNELAVNENKNLLRPRITLQVPQNVAPIRLRNIVLQQNQIRLLLHGRVECPRAVAEQNGSKPGRLHFAPEQSQEHTVTIHNEDRRLNVQAPAPQRLVIRTRPDAMHGTSEPGSMSSRTW